MGRIRGCVLCCFCRPLTLLVPLSPSRMQEREAVAEVKRRTKQVGDKLSKVKNQAQITALRANVFRCPLGPFLTNRESRRSFQLPRALERTRTEVRNRPHTRYAKRIYDRESADLLLTHWKGKLGWGWGDRGNICQLGTQGAKGKVGGEKKENLDKGPEPCRFSGALGGTIRSLGTDFWRGAA